MKNIKFLSACLAFLAGLAYTASGATNGVVLGQNFQSVIDASSSGDTLIVQPGVYPDTNVVFNKALTVLPSGTNGSPIQFLGTIQVQGPGVSSFQRAYFGTNVQTTSATVSFFDSYFNGAVNVAGGKVTMKRTILNYPLTLSNNAAMEALRMTNNATVTATAASGSGTPFLAVQSSFFDSVALSGYKVWLGYNNFTNSTVKSFCLGETNCDSVLIGNKFTLNNPSPGTVIYETGGTLKAFNNLVLGNASYGSPWTGIGLNSTPAEIVNNTIRANMYPGPDIFGIQAGGVGLITIRANVIYFTSIGGGYGGGSDADVQATGAASQSVFVSYCDLWAGNPNTTIVQLLGVSPVPVNCLLQVDPNLAADGTLNPGSPCINAGPPETIYNNRDGTRNTMGYTGGPYYNPANYTNNNPMIFLLIGQQTAIKGIQTTIPVSVGASAGH
jgi:hypothetical protein